MRVAARAFALALLVAILVAVPASARSVRFDEGEETAKSPPQPLSPSSEAARVHSAKRADAVPTPREARVVATGEGSTEDVLAGDASAEGNATAPTEPKEEKPPDNTLGRWWWGGWYGWKGWWGYYTYPYYTSYWYAPHPLSRPPYFIPSRPFDSCLSTPPASTLVPASSRSGYWNYGYGYHKSADAKAPESVNEMTAADAEARAKRVSRARGPRPRGARASTRRASSERTDVASSCVEWLGVDDAALAAAPSNVAVRDDACCWPSGCALAASAGCVAEDGGACCVPDSERLEEC